MPLLNNAYVAAAAGMVYCHTFRAGRRLGDITCFNDGRLLDITAFTRFTTMIFWGTIMAHSFDDGMPYFSPRSLLAIFPAAAVSVSGLSG